MDKYLFTDGTSGVIEAHSQEELRALIRSATEPARARIWIFNSHEWISLPAFLSQNPAFANSNASLVKAGPAEELTKPGKRRTWLKTPLMILVATTGALLIFNFTSARWVQAEPLNTQAARPANVPRLDLDSLIQEVEWQRGKPLDKNTRINFRLRNNWPEHILLELQSEKETRSNHHRFYNLSVRIDNATGFVLDKAAVQVQAWKNGSASVADTLLFSNIRYDKLQVRSLDRSFRCDSISVSFLSVQARAFNFCYAYGTKNNSGNDTDPWFCVKGNPANH